MNGPLFPGHLKVDFGDLVALEKAFKENGDRIAGFLFEPIQGEAGVVIPHDGYLKSVRDLCSKYNILMIADEIQSSLARSGKLMACDWEEVRPDVVILGKALGGGVIPVSAVLAEKDVMLCIRPGEHGRAEATKDDRFGDLSRSQYGLVDLAAALFYRACVNRDKPSSSEKRVKREHADACLREELKKGKWLWNAAFCCLTHNYKRRMSKILFIYWFEGIIVSFERLLEWGWEKIIITLDTTADSASASSSMASTGHKPKSLDEEEDPGIEHISNEGTDAQDVDKSTTPSSTTLPTTDDGIEENKLKRKSKPSSWVWEHFTKVSFVLHFMLLHKEMLPRMGI
ncbi:uncharacterized protein LOC133817967 isoform X3 [Humulus lupulus]|uniref:uncharacterized protein LOC133817967 isoform X3 n=1 Tax=Humulus lupulus TaxID=3486 RepID=UPI002B4130D8|nr:uncharacterized protein LOC133817967 isoform X3 [Humulus lupulus]